MGEFDTLAIEGQRRGVQQPRQAAALQFHLPLLAQAYPDRFTPGVDISFQVARRKVRIQ